VAVVMVDALGNVYATGSSYDSGTYYDYTTIKYPNLIGFHILRNIGNIA
jgi:hypothetical protein